MTKFKFMIVALFATLALAFTACGDDKDEPDPVKPDNTNTEAAKLYGSWKGNIDGDSFVLTFTSNGKMNEKVDGVDMGDVKFTFKNGELTFSQITALEDCIGSAPIVVNFLSDTRIQIYKKSDSASKYTLNKI